MLGSIVCQIVWLGSSEIERQCDALLAHQCVSQTSLAEVIAGIVCPKKCWIARTASNVSQCMFWCNVRWNMRGMPFGPHFALEGRLLKEYLFDIKLWVQNQWPFWSGYSVNAKNECQKSISTLMSAEKLSLISIRDNWISFLKTPFLCQSVNKCNGLLIRTLKLN